MKDWAKKRAKPILARAPWLKWGIGVARTCLTYLKNKRTHLKHRTTHRQRTKELPQLLEQYNIEFNRVEIPKCVIFVVVDCLRKDHLSLYGYNRNTTPFLKSVAERAAVFENAITPASWTYPVVASLLTGLYPHNHGGALSENLRNMGSGMFPNKVLRHVLALPEILAYLKFETVVISEFATSVLAALAFWFKYSSGYYPRSEQYLDYLLRFIDRNKRKRSFIYWHLTDLHAPIIIPEPYQNAFGRIPKIPKLEGWDFQEGPYQDHPMFERYRENRIKLYDAALSFVDAQIARLFEYLKESDLLDSTLIFMTADHGEEFWDHVELERRFFYDPRGCYGLGHGHNLFQEVANVPLIAMGPEIVPGRYKRNVSTVDVVPTVLELCKVDNKLKLDGLNLFDLDEGRTIISEEIAYGYEKKAVFQDNWKFLHSEGDNVSLLFDLYRDPGENYDLAKMEAKRVEQLRSALPRSQAKGEPLEVDRELKKRLQALGYINPD